MVLKVPLETVKQMAIATEAFYKSEPRNIEFQNSAPAAAVSVVNIVYIRVNSIIMWSKAVLHLALI